MLIRMTNKSEAMIAVCVLAWLSCVSCSVLVPTYVLPPASFKQQRDQRSLPALQGLRTLSRLAGGHMRLPSLNTTDKSVNEQNNYADYFKNTFGSIDKDVKYDKFAGVVVKTENQNVGWNQGQWDDGMLMSSAGNGNEKNKQKTSDDDDDKKTLADQVAEGKYGLIQKELFSKLPVRPGILSYASNPETKVKDNESNLGGLKNDEIWLAEDHLLVLKGGAYQEHGSKPGEGGSVTWAPIDAYQAPPRQVKIPQNPEVPPPFPVRLADDGPLVFLTKNGSIPAPLFPAKPPGGFGAFPPPPFAYPPPSPSSPQGPYTGNFTPGGAPFPIPPFPFLPPRNESEFPPFPFPGPINSSFPGGLPPGASFLPPPGNLSDLYDEDDPSIYYPPPYSFSYQADNSSKVPAGPLVPGIILPPPPDFFAPLDKPTSSKPTAHAYPPTPIAPATAVVKTQPNAYLPPAEKPPTKDSDNVVDPKSTPKTITPRPKTPKVVVISKPIGTRKPQTFISTIKPTKTTEKITSPVPTYKYVKTTTAKPTTASIVNAYYPDKVNSVVQSPRPFLVYGPPEKSTYPEKTYVTSTPVPLRAFYSNNEYQNILPQLQIKETPTVTRIRPDFIQNVRPNGKSVASFYFYEEPVSKLPSPTAGTYDGRNYYPLNNNGQITQNDLGYSPQLENDFSTSGNVEFRPIPSREPSPFFFIPQRQGSRTLTQEYFSIQKPKLQNNYVQQVVIPQQNRPDFYEQIANIQQTIDYYTTHRPKINLYQQIPYREARQKPKTTPRPVYQFSFQTNNIRPEQNTFKAPEMDNEPFRPMVTYSKPYNVKVVQSTPKTVFSENIKSTTESALPSKYYTTTKSNDYDYEDENQDKKNYVKTVIKPSTILNHDPAAQSPKSKKARTQQIPTTKSPVDHAYYTKQEEGLFDDITKNYFTIFGQKIEHSNIDEAGIAATAPLKPVEVTTIKPAITRVKYTETNKVPLRNDQQHIISLASDTQINYRQPRPIINPDSEFIPIVNPVIQAKYNAEQQLKRLKDHILQKPKVHNVEIIKSEDKEAQHFVPEQIDLIQPNRLIQSLHSDLNIKYGKELSVRPRPQIGEGRPGSLVAYRLPGEGAHVYFLTPQPAKNDFRSSESIEELN